ncbi:hypothetical protein FOCC_FOCC006983 [Frankliniella occidentalis]|nr:hypothetical protein FOCC_FOCC006983 [Frankliniella occidentalis]
MCTAACPLSVPSWAEGSSPNQGPRRYLRRARGGRDGVYSRRNEKGRADNTRTPSPPHSRRSNSTLSSRSRWSPPSATRCCSRRAAAWRSAPWPWPTWSSPRTSWAAATTSLSAPAAAATGFCCNRRCAWSPSG